MNVPPLKIAGAGQLGTIAKRLMAVATPEQYQRFHLLTLLWEAVSTYFTLLV